MIRITIPLAMFAVTACAPMEGEDDFVSDAPAASVVGEARSCVNITQVRRSRVHDDRTIDFDIGTRTYRNHLSPGCANLGFERSYTYETSLSQLCEGEIIYVLRTFGGRPERGAGCSLGEFVPIEYVDRSKDVMN